MGAICVIGSGRTETGEKVETTKKRETESFEVKAKNIFLGKNQTLQGEDSVMVLRRRRLMSAEQIPNVHIVKMCTRTTAD